MARYTMNICISVDTLAASADGKERTLAALEKVLGRCMEQLKSSVKAVPGVADTYLPRANITEVLGSASTGIEVQQVFLVRQKRK